MQEQKIKKKRIIHSSFLKLLHQILENVDYKEIISWNLQGDKFIIYDKTQLILKILPKYFRHSKYSSFLRQLNFYGFQKSCFEKSHQTYYNPQFTKQNPNFNLTKKQKSYQNSFELETMQLQNEMKKIKQGQEILKQQINGSIKTVDQLSDLVNFILNSTFEIKMQISNQAQLYLIAIFNILFGMEDEFNQTFQELIDLLFPQCEIKRLEKLDILPYTLRTKISFFQIQKYLSSYYPSSQFSQYSEVFETIKRQFSVYEKYQHQVI